MNFMFSLFSALGLGALHALEPGHGKGVMGAYLVMSRGRTIDAVILGLTSAVTHTLVVVVLAVLAKSATSMVVTGTGIPGQQFEMWLQLVSGVLIVFIGLRLILARRRNTCSCCGHHHDHSHHGHKPPGWQRVDLGTLLTLGFTNGLMPCPSALAVLLLSISTGTLVNGLLLVFAFGVGGAVALVGVGIAFVKLSSYATRLMSNRAWSRLAAVSAALIVFIGAATTYGAARNL